MFYLAQAGATLQVIKSDGTVTTLTLPSGVTIDATKRAKVGILNGIVFIANSPSQNLWLDPSDLTLRPAGLLPPISAPILSAGAGTGLTGIYLGKVSFAVKNSGGQILSESPLCALPSNAFTASNQSILWSAIP